MFKLIIHGKVQGVGYRAWLKNTARSLNLRGCVYNNNNGTVEAIIFCSKKQIAGIVKLCYVGSNFSKVESINYFQFNDKNIYEFGEEFFIKTN